MSAEKALIVLSHLADNAVRHKSSTIRLEAVGERTTVLLTVSMTASRSRRRTVTGSSMRSSPSAATSGTGMGLAIARAVMASHGGPIRLKPTDQGAAFELQFPAG